MKHLKLLSSLFIILLLASCTKQESILPERNPEAIPNQEVERRNLTLTKNQFKSRYIKDETPIRYSYFLDGQKLESGESYDINDPSLFVQLIATTEMKKGTEFLKYEFHAYNDKYEFTYWAKERHILVQDALDITKTLEMYPNNSEARQKFEESGELPDSYINYARNTTDGVLMSSLGNVEAAPLKFVFYRNSLTNGAFTKADKDYTPILSDEWNNEISALEGNNMYLPTILFEDDFYQNRINPIIFNRSGHPIIFEGPLDELNGKVSSIF